MSRAYLTTSEAAAVVGVTAAYIRGEIRDGRLDADVIHREPIRGRQSARPVIRIYPEQLGAYVRRYWPRVTFHGEPIVATVATESMDVTE
jgi:hypothetical protein